MLLGTSGGPPYWPGEHRAGIASAVVVGDRYYLVDAGHGVVRQIRDAHLSPRSDADLDGPLDTLSGIFLTHLHSDHVVDLNNILTEGLFNGFQYVQRIPIWGPGNRGAVPELFGAGKAPKPINPRNPTPGTKEMLELMVRTYATDFNDRLFDNRKPAPGQLWEAFDVPVPKRYTKDPNGNPHPAMDPFTFFEDVGGIAQEAGVGTLVLSHLVPGNRADEAWEGAAAGFDGRLVIDRDLDVIGIG